MNAARVVRPLAAALGAPARAVGGAPGILARDNATRNPARTASTASALMIGLALVTFVGDIQRGPLQVVRGRRQPAIRRRLRGDGDQHVHADRCRRREVAAGTAGRERRHPDPRGIGSLPRKRPRPDRGARRTWRPGSDSTGRPAAPRFPASSEGDGFFTDTDYAKSHHLHVGSAVNIEFPERQAHRLRLLGPTRSRMAAPRSGTRRSRRSSSTSTTPGRGTRWF